MGNVKNPDKVYNNSNKIAWMATDLPEECKLCKLLPICQGGCTIRYKDGSPECRYNIDSLKEYLKIYNKICSEEEENEGVG